MTPLVGSNISVTGDTNVSDTPNWNPNFKGPVVLKDPNHWFDANAFLLPTPGTFGDVSRGSLVGPSLVTVDPSPFKKFTDSERVSVQLRAEAFIFSITPISITRMPSCFREALAWSGRIP